MLVEQEVANNSLVPIPDVMSSHLNSRMLKEFPEREQDVNRTVIEEEIFLMFRILHLHFFLII